MAKTAKKFTLAELAKLTRTTLVGNPDQCIVGVEALEAASPEDASFLANPRYREAMLHSKAGVICISQAVPPIDGKNFLISEEPSRTFQQIVEALHLSSNRQSGFEGIHATAVIHPTAKIAKDAKIGPYVVIDRNVTIGSRTEIAPFVSIGPSVAIGEECRIHAHVVIREACTLGNRVILQPGAIIGSCGFGYTTNAKGEHIKIEQLGNVIIEDDVEIGACTAIDRARFKVTSIGKGTKIDNLVQIAHNVTLGEHNIIVSQSGIAGSSKTGKHVILGGQAGVVGHLEITDNVMIATRGGVSKSINKPGKYAGGPVMPLAEYNRQQVQLRKIDEYVKKIEELERRLSELELR